MVIFFLIFWFSNKNQKSSNFSFYSLVFSLWPIQWKGHLRSTFRVYHPIFIGLIPLQLWGKTKISTNYVGVLPIPKKNLILIPSMWISSTWPRIRILSLGEVVGHRPENLTCLCLALPCSYPRLGIFLQRFRRVEWGWLATQTQYKKFAKLQQDLTQIHKENPAISLLILRITYQKSLGTSE